MRGSTSRSTSCEIIQAVHTTIVLNFGLEPDKAGNVYKSLGLGCAERVIEPIVKERFKASPARYTAEARRLQRQGVSPELVRLSEVEAQMKAIDKWDGHLPNVTGGALPFISLGVMGEGKSR